MQKNINNEYKHIPLIAHILNSDNIGEIKLTDKYHLFIEKNTDSEEGDLSIELHETSVDMIDNISQYAPKCFTEKSTIEEVKNFGFEMLTKYLESEKEETMDCIDIEEKALNVLSDMLNGLMPKDQDLELPDNVDFDTFATNEKYAYCFDRARNMLEDKIIAECLENGVALDLEKNDWEED